MKIRAGLVAAGAVAVAVLSPIAASAGDGTDGTRVTDVGTDGTRVTGVDPDGTRVTGVGTDDGILN